MLRTAAEIIEVLGGTTAAAATTGVKAPTVSGWKARGAIPARHSWLVSEELARRGEKCDRAVFGFGNRP